MPLLHRLSPIEGRYSNLDKIETLLEEIFLYIVLITVQETRDVFIFDTILLHPM